MTGSSRRLRRTRRAGATGALVALVCASVALVPGMVGGAGAATAGPGISSKAALAGAGCDADTGRIAVQWYAAPPCVRPFEAGDDNGGATARRDCGRDRGHGAGPAGRQGPLVDQRRDQGPGDRPERPVDRRRARRERAAVAVLADVGAHRRVRVRRGEWHRRGGPAGRRDRRHRHQAVHGAGHRAVRAGRRRGCVPTPGASGEDRGASAADDAGGAERAVREEHGGVRGQEPREEEGRVCGRRAQGRATGVRRRVRGWPERHRHLGVRQGVREVRREDRRPAVVRGAARPDPRGAGRGIPGAGAHDRGEAQGLGRHDGDQPRQRRVRRDGEGVDRAGDRPGLVPGVGRERGRLPGPRLLRSPHRPGAVGARVRPRVVRALHRGQRQGCDRQPLPVVLGARPGHALTRNPVPAVAALQRRAPRGAEAHADVVRRGARQVRAHRGRVLRHDHEPRDRLPAPRHHRAASARPSGGGTPTSRARRTRSASRARASTCTSTEGSATSRASSPRT